MGEKAITRSADLLEEIARVREESVDPESVRQGKVEEARRKLMSGELESPASLEKAAAALLGEIPDEDLYSP
jgi:hypothetical protein